MVSNIFRNLFYTLEDSGCISEKKSIVIKFLKEQFKVSRTPFIGWNQNLHFKQKLQLDFIKRKNTKVLSQQNTLWNILNLVQRA